MATMRLAEAVRHGLSLPHDNLHFGLDGQIFDMDELVESLVRAYLGAVEENERLRGGLIRAIRELDGDMDEQYEMRKRVEELQEENERLKGYERSVDAYMEATKNYQRSLQIEQAKVEELEASIAEKDGAANDAESRYEQQHVRLLEIEEEMRDYKVEVAVARDHYRSLASGGFGEVSLPWYWNEQADRVDKLIEREGPALQRRST